MVIKLIGRNTIESLLLPNIAQGQYIMHIADNSAQIIFSKQGDEWIISGMINCCVQNIKRKKFILEKDNYYTILLEKTKEVYILYCSLGYEDNYYHLTIKNTPVLYVGSDKKSNHIVYEYPLIKKVHVKIYSINGHWVIQNYDSRFCISVCGEPLIDNERMLFNGDWINIYGLTIILINNEIFINNPRGKVKWHTKYLTLNNHVNVKYIEGKIDENLREQKKDVYFLRTPRIQEVLKEVEISIDPPTIQKKQKELPAILVLASSFSMAGMTLLTLFRTIDQLSNNKIDTKNAITNFITSGLMLLTAIVIPIVNRQYTKKIQISNEKDENEKYKRYIKKKNDFLDKLFNTSRKILYKNYVSPEECIDIILKNQSRLWERQITDKDFLTIRVGIGNMPSNIKIKYSEDEKNDEVIETLTLMNDFIEKAKTFKDVPVTYSLVEKNISAIIYNKEEIYDRYIQGLILQLIALHSYDELKIVVLLKNNMGGKWDYIKMIPHIWSNSKDIRFFADDYNRTNEILQYLEDELKKRQRKEEKYDYKKHRPYYLIIVEDYRSVENFNFIKDILKNQENMGFSILFLTDSMLKLPRECQTFIEINENEGTLFESQNIDANTLNFKINTEVQYFFDKISPILFNILIKYEDEKESSIPSNYTFLEMYNVGRIEQLNILYRWKKNDSTLSLSAPIGVNGQGQLINLDIHEKFHGPHGLIAGSTGSGKSEFIITYILSLAINYHPDDVNFVLIDYKGGGLAGAFKRPGIELPHLVGTITNITKGSLQRSLDSIQSELKRRQVQFNEARLITGESTIDIYKYQKYYHSGVLKKPIAHLFIISDEFAELKQQEPEFMSELISVARIGRSLGVHLILATQKPGGVVDEQIRSNSKFGICLKVQTPSDSNDIINIPDATKLKGPGQFYIKVGNDDYLELGQSAWAGALYYPSDEIRMDVDNSIEFISNTGRILKKVDDIQNSSTIESQGEQLTNIVKYISDLAKKENIYEEPLWLNPIPETIYLQDIRNKYHIKNQKNEINPIIGEYDDPSRQLQNVMSLNLSKYGNTVIYGNAESGKETLLNTIIYDTISTHSPEEAQIYVIDFGSEAMKIFKKSPSVGDVILANESEKLARLFMLLQKEMKDRKEILSNYNGDYNYYMQKTKKPMPTYIIILNNYENFVENTQSKFEEVLEKLLREGPRYKFVFIFTLSTTGSIRYRMQQNFKQKIVLQMNNDDDYPTLLNQIGKKRPSAIFGRGIVTLGEKEYYEYQTAKICESEELNEMIMKLIEEQNNNKKISISAKEIKTVPSIVTINDLSKYLNGITEFPIGISNKNITPCIIDLSKSVLNLMLSNSVEDFYKFILNIIEEIKLIPDINIVIIDAERMIQEEDGLKEKYIEFFKKLNGKKKIKDSICIIIGLEKFIRELGSEALFQGSLDNAAELKKVHYIIFESAVKINNFKFSDWYKKYSPNNTGVWLGNEVKEQYILTPSSAKYKISNECGNSYGYIFTKGKPSLIKLLGMKENGEENE